MSNDEGGWKSGESDIEGRGLGKEGRTTVYWGGGEVLGF